MKRSELNKIIKEEIERELVMEGIIDSLLMMFLSPKIKRDVKKLKNSPDWKELVQKINTTREEMEMYNKRFEDYLEREKENAEWFKKRGMKPPVNVNKYYKTR